MTTTHTCPYASTLEEESSTPSSPRPSSPPTTAAEALALAKTSCPAFKNSCPFKDAKNSEDVKKTMLSIPSTHRNDGIEGEGETDNASIGKQVKMALEHMHQVSQTLQQKDKSAVKKKMEEDKYVLEGGCPFKTYYQGSKKEGEPFVNVMENLSLSAIMSRMACDLEEQERKLLEDSDDNNDNHDETTEKKDVQVQAPAATTTGKRRSLSMALKTGTTTSHTSAENVHFVRNFIRGKIDKTLYIRLLSSLYYIYKTLEEELNIHAPQHFPTLHFPKELERVESLEDDLDYYHGEDWRQRCEVIYKESEATKDYCERIRYIARTNPLLLLSHGYTRYLGDLSGGRILARVARKALNLSKDGDGLRFYEFEHVSNVKGFKDLYRTALDGLGLVEEDVERVVGEANVAFALNVRVFEELDVRGGLKGASVMELGEATGYLDRVLEEQRKRKEEGGVRRGVEEGVRGEDAKCPFAFMGGPNPHKNDGEKELTTTGTSKDNTTTTTTMDEKVNSAKPKGKCPWPFILLHDFRTGMQDYRSKIILGLICCWIWSYLVQSDFYRQICLKK